MEGIKAILCRMKHPGPLTFGLLCVGAAALLAPRAFALLPLYLDSGVRGQVQQALERTAEREGLLLSGFTVRGIRSDGMTATHRMHTKGRDMQRCFTVDFATFTPRACDEQS